MKKLSIILPVYNEEKTLEAIVKKVLQIKLLNNMQKEIIIIDDGSSDSSMGIIHKLSNKYKNVISLNNKSRLGKSQTVVRGILESSGDWVIVQDADLEYKPKEIALLLSLALEKKHDVVYGDRFAKKNKVIYWYCYIGNRLLSFVSNLFTYSRIKKWINDMEVCYKLVRGDIARKIALEMKSKSMFGFEPEITARLSKYKANKKHLSFGILPISYSPRTLREGKKMKAFKHGSKALIEILKYNIFR